VPRGQRDESLRPYSRFPRQEPILFYQVAPQLYSRPRSRPATFFGSAGNRTRASGCVAKNSDHYTTEAVRKQSYTNRNSILQIPGRTEENHGKTEIRNELLIRSNYFFLVSWGWGGTECS
jgi:hypothetical protein